MSRAKIGVVVAGVVAALTATAYLLTTASLESRISRDANARVQSARQALWQYAALDAQGLIKRAERYATDTRLPGALAETDLQTRFGKANEVFTELVATNRDGKAKSEEAKPDFIALVAENGRLVVMQDDRFGAEEDWEAKYPAVKLALKDGRGSKDIWEFGNGKAVYKVGIAPIYSADHSAVKGALVVAYALNAKEAQTQKDLVGMDVAYFFGDRVRATSFRRGGAEENEALRKPLFEKGLAQAALSAAEKGTAVPLRTIQIGDDEFMASASDVPLNHADKTSGFVVMLSLTKAMEPIAAVQLTILLLGLGALVIAILAMLVTARLILGPAEEIELGVTEIINGNVDHTFRPAGADFDGLANALNVMLARLLGRPEPGEEEFDENGNLTTPTAGKLLLDEEGAATAALGGASPETLALAQEPEHDYYRRIFGEYLDARKKAGEDVTGVHFEGFVAKLRLTEANLKKKYNSKGVRFRVDSKGGEVTLKPIPIL